MTFVSQSGNKDKKWTKHHLTLEHKLVSTQHSLNPDFRALHHTVGLLLTQCDALLKVIWKWTQTSFKIHLFSHPQWASFLPLLFSVPFKWQEKGQSSRAGFRHAGQQVKLCLGVNVPRLSHCVILSLRVNVQLEGAWIILLHVVFFIVILNCNLLCQLTFSTLAAVFCLCVYFEEAM